MENWTDILMYLFWTAYPTLGRSAHNSKKERFPGGGSPWWCPLRGWGLSFPVKASMLLPGVQYYLIVPPNLIGHHLPSAAPHAPSIPAHSTESILIISSF